MPLLGLAENFVYIHVQISVRSGSNAQGLPGAFWGLVRPVVNIYSRIWANILPCITWNSRSCGDARSRGVRFGRAQLRIVSII